MKRAEKIFIVATLTILWIVSSIYYAFKTDVSPSLLVFPDRNNILVEKNLRPTNGIYTVKGQFEARENNLGIIFIRSSLDQKLIKEKYYITFKIKESGAASWYFQSTQRMSPVFTYYPYGFPIIPNSKGKLYEYRIETKSSNYIKNIASDIVRPVGQGGYLYPTKDINGFDIKMRELLGKKLQSWLENSDYIATSFLFILPLLYVLFQKQLEHFYDAIIHWRPKNKHILNFYKKVKFSLRTFKGYKKHFFLSVFIMFCVDILFVERIANLIVFFITILWIYSIFKFKLKSYDLYKFGFLIMIFTSIFILFGYISIAHKSSIWFFIIMTFGTIQALGEQHEK